MQDLTDKVAVITGAASGIGLAMAQRAASEGMRVVLADIEEAPLAAAAQQLRDEGAEALAVVTDVSSLSSIEDLRDETLSVYGGAHLLCNNAGVAVGRLTWETTNEDWNWVLGVNLWGVVHGIRAFLPGMLASGNEGHIVNVASMAGLITAPGMSIYNTTKHAVVGLSETLYYELQLTGARVGVSVLCPGWVNTRIMDAERNRPAGMRHTTAAQPAFAGPMEDMARQALAHGMRPSGVAEQVFDAVQNNRFWILTHPDMAPMVEQRFRNAVTGRNPEMPQVG